MMKTRNPQCQGFQTTFLKQTDMMFLSFVMAGTFEVPHRHGVRDASGRRLRIEERARIYEMRSHDSMVVHDTHFSCEIQFHSFLQGLGEHQELKVGIGFRGCVNTQVCFGEAILDARTRRVFVREHLGNATERAPTGASVHV